MVPKRDASGTPISISVYTDIECQTPSTISTNVSLSLGVCAVTPGLGSVSRRDVPCANGVVQVWGFTDITCTTEIFLGLTSYGDGCYGRATPGAVAAILLNCDENSPGTPTATTTIKVAPIATGGSSSAKASSSAGSTSYGGESGSATNASSGWDALSTGAKVGIIAGSLVGILVLSYFIGLVNKKRTVTAPSKPNERGRDLERDNQMHPGAHYHDIAVGGSGRQMFGNHYQNTTNHYHSPHRSPGGFWE